MTKATIRAVFVTRSSEVWGAEETLLLLLEESEANGFRPTVLTERASPLIPLLEARNISVVRHEFARHPALERSGSLSRATALDLLGEASSILRGARRVARILRQFDVAVAFSLWQSPEVAVGGFLARTPAIIDLHETFDGKAGKRVLNVLLKGFTAVIAPSKLLISDYGAARRAAIVPRPVAIEHRAIRPELARSQPITVGMFGQISPHKRVLELADELLRADDSGRVRLLVVGGRPENERSPYETRVREVLAGFTNGSAVIERQPTVDGLMRECDFIVNVSAHEAFGRTVVEGTINGATPLVLRGSGPAEIVEATGTGLIFDDIHDLVTHICKSDRPVIAAETIARVKSAYSPPEIGRQYFDSLRRLLGQERRPG